MDIKKLQSIAKIEGCEDLDMSLLILKIDKLIAANPPQLKSDAAMNLSQLREDEVGKMLNKTINDNLSIPKVVE